MKKILAPFITVLMAYSPAAFGLGNRQQVASVAIHDSPSLDTNYSLPYSFGEIHAGESADHTFVVYNSGLATATQLGYASVDGSISMELPDGFDFKGGRFPGDGGTCSDSLPALQSCTVVVTFEGPSPVTSGDWYSYYRNELAGAIRVPYFNGLAVVETARDMIGILSNPPAPGPVSVSLLANGMSGAVSVHPHEYVVLSWTAQYAQSCVLSFGFPVYSPIGSITIPNPHVNTTYVVTCVGGGQVSASSVVVNIINSCNTNILAQANNLRTPANQLPLKDCPAGVNVFDSRCGFYDGLNFPDGGGQNQTAPKMVGLVPGTQLVLTSLTGNVIDRIYQNRVEQYTPCSQKLQELKVQFTDDNNVRIDPAGYPHGRVPLAELVGTGFTVPPNATKAWVGYISNSYWDAYPTRTAGSYPPGGPECIYTFTNIECR